MAEHIKIEKLDENNDMPQSSKNELEAANAAESKGAYEKLFTLRFRIPLEDYIQFHILMAADEVKKNRRKTVLLGLMEFIFGMVFLFSLFTTDTEGGWFYYAIIAVLILMGLYGMTYYRFFYEKSLRKAVAKQHEKFAYLKNDIVVNFYPNKLSEFVEDKELDTLWHTVKEVRVSKDLFLIMLGEKRCLLIPKKEIAEQADMFDTYLRKICESYEKPRYEI